MDMKKEFLEPEVELIRLNVVDVITRSSGLDDEETDWMPA